MSKKIDRSIRHPWDDWLKQNTFTLKQGTDFRGMPHSMSVQVRSAASKRGIRVSVTIEGKVLRVTVLGRMTRRGVA